MKQRIPDGDPVLALNDEEYQTWQAFSQAWAERHGGALPTLDETEQHLTASLLCFIRERCPEPPDFTDCVITWDTSDGSVHIADCLSQVNDLCLTPLGVVHARRVSLFEQDPVC